MALRKSLFFSSALLLVLLLAESQAKPSQDLSKPQTKEELSDLAAGAGAARGVPVAAKNKTAVVEDTPYDSDSEAESEEQLHRSYPHRDEDQLNSATNLVLAQNYKYDVEILESGDADQDDSSMDDVDDLEERFKGRGVVFSTDTETFASENIEMSPVVMQPNAVSQGHVLLGVVVVALALVSIGLYAGLVIWRSHHLFSPSPGSGMECANDWSTTTWRRKRLVSTTSIITSMHRPRRRLRLGRSPFRNLVRFNSIRFDSIRSDGGLQLDLVSV